MRKILNKETATNTINARLNKETMDLTLASIGIIKNKCDIKKLAFNDFEDVENIIDIVSTVLDKEEYTDIAFSTCLGLINQFTEYRKKELAYLEDDEEQTIFNNVCCCLDLLDDVFGLDEDTVLALELDIEKEQSIGEIEEIIKEEMLDVIELESSEDLAFILYEVGCKLGEYSFNSLKSTTLLTLIRVYLEIYEFNEDTEDAEILDNNIEFCLEYLEQDYDMTKEDVLATI